MFHNIVAKSLYTTNRSRPDTCTAVAFLKTIVIGTNKDYWVNPVHLMKFIRETGDIPLILRNMTVES